MVPLETLSGDTKSSSNNYTVTINHPNINLSLQGRNKSSNKPLSPFITTYSNKLIQAVLIFSNDSLIHIKNGLIEIPNLKVGTSLNLEGICTQYYNDLSITKIYSGEKSNILEVSLPPNISLLPFILDRLDDETLFKYSIKGSTNYIKNVLTNTDNG